VSVGGQIEQSRFVVRFVVRFVLRHVGGVMVNPAAPRDMRAFADGSINIELWRQLGIRLGASVLHDTVVPEGIRPTDVRLTTGIAWTRPARKDASDHD